MSEKKCPLNREELEALTELYPTPFHIYDEKGIRENARQLKAAFAWNPGFKEYFAVKATPNPYLMKILKSEGFGSDCSSLPELLLSESIGVVGEDIICTSNNTPAYEYKKAAELGAIINLDDIITRVGGGAAIELESRDGNACARDGSRVGGLLSRDDFGGCIGIEAIPRRQGDSARDAVVEVGSRFEVRRHSARADHGPLLGIGEE